MNLHKHFKLSLLGALLCSSYLVAQVSFPTEKLVAGDRTFDMHLGESLDLHKDLAIVGAPSAAADGGIKSEAGAAYVFEQSNSGWKELQKLTAPVPEGSDWFGYAVAASDSFLIVGAPGKSDTLSYYSLEDCGAVYVYKRGVKNWIFWQRLSPSDKSKLAWFGSSLAIDGTNLIIGAQKMKHEANLPTMSKSNVGKVYVFELDGHGFWVESQKLSAPQIQAGEEFGNSVSIFGNQLIVGGKKWDYYVDPNCNWGWVGRAYIYERKQTNGWTLEAVITSDSLQQLEKFGASVSIGEKYAVVGAPGKDVEGPVGQGWHYGATGRLYVFERNKVGNWILMQKLQELGPGNGDYLGCSVAIEDERIVAGALGKEYTTSFGGFMETGIAYVYDLQPDNTWLRTQVLEPSVKADFDAFGSCVSISGKNVWITAPQEDHDGSDDPNSYSGNAGAAYFF